LIIGRRRDSGALNPRAAEPIMSSPIISSSVLIKSTPRLDNQWRLTTRIGSPVSCLKLKQQERKRGRKERKYKKNKAIKQTKSQVVTSSFSYIETTLVFGTSQINLI